MANANLRGGGPRRVQDTFLSTLRAVLESTLRRRAARAIDNLITAVSVIIVVLVLCAIGSCQQAQADQAIPIHDHAACSGLRDVGDVWFAWPSRACTQWSPTGAEEAYRTKDKDWRSPAQEERMWNTGKATVTGDLAFVEAPKYTHQMTGKAEQTSAQWGITVNKKLPFNEVSNIDGTVTIEWQDIARDPYGAYYDMVMTVSNVKVRPHTESAMKDTDENSVLIMNSTKSGCNTNASFCSPRMIKLIYLKNKKHKQRTHVSVSMDIDVEILNRNHQPISKDEGKDVVAAFRDLDAQVLEENNPSGPWSESVTLRSGFIGSEVHAGVPIQKDFKGQSAPVQLFQDGARYYGAQTVNNENLNAQKKEEDATGFSVRAYANGYSFTWTGDHCGTKLFDKAGGAKPSPQTIGLTMKKTLDGQPATEAGRFTFEATATHAGNGTTIKATASNDDQGQVPFTFEAVKAGTYQVAVRETSTGTYAVGCGEATLTVESDGDGGIQATNTTWSGSDTFANYRYVQHAIPVEKRLICAEDRKLPDASGAFSFTLVPKSETSGKTTELAEPTTITNPDPDGGTATFGAITFKKPGTYTYTVSESGNVSHVANDPKAEGETVTIKVGLADDKLAVTSVQATNAANRTADGVLFTNTYVPPEACELAIPVTKRLENNTPWDAPTITGKCEFELSAIDEAPLPDETGRTAANPDPDGGTAHFGTITYEEAGTYRYRITERCNVSGIANDPDASAGKEIAVTVTETADNKLQATTDADETAVFTNSYEDRPVHATIPVTKQLKCGESTNAPDISGKFTFELHAADGAPLPESGTTTVNPAADGGTAHFGEIAFPQPGTYRYTVTESGKVDGITNDDAAKVGKDVSITVGKDRSVTIETEESQSADSDGNSGSNRTDKGVTFTNSVPSAARFAIPVTKSLDGATPYNQAPDISGAFTFALTAADGAPMPASEKTTVANPSATGGVAYFDPIEFSHEGLYTYVITESGTADRVTNDPSANAGKRVRIEVACNEAENRLEAKIASVSDVDFTSVQGPSEKEGDTATANETGTAMASVKDSNGTSAEQTAVVFTNRVQALPATLQLPVQKVLRCAGDSTPPDITGKFTFNLEAIDDAPMPENKTAAIANPDADGGFAAYGPITFDTTGTYRYRITEEGTVPDIDNDAASERIVHVKVTHDEATNTLCARIGSISDTDEGDSTTRETVHSTAMANVCLPDIAQAICAAYNKQMREEIPAEEADSQMVSPSWWERGANGTCRFVLSDATGGLHAVHASWDDRANALQVTPDGDRGHIPSGMALSSEHPLTVKSPTVTVARFTNTYNPTLAMPETGGSGAPLQAAVAGLAAMAGGGALIAWKRRFGIRMPHMGCSSQTRHK